MPHFYHRKPLRVPPPRRRKRRKKRKQGEVNCVGRAICIEKKKKKEAEEELNKAVRALNTPTTPARRVFPFHYSSLGHALELFLIQPRWANFNLKLAGFKLKSYK